MITYSSYVQWCNENEGRAYPLRDTATRLDDRGKLLPDDLIVDLCVMVPAEYTDVYCASVRSTPALVSISLAAAHGPLLVGVFDRSTYAPYTAVALTPMADNVSGWVVFGAHSSSVTELYIFSGAAQSGLEVRAVRTIDAPPIRKVMLLGIDPSLYVDGIVSLSGEGAMQLSAGSTDQRIAFSLAASASASFMNPADTYADSGCPVPPIRRISGVSPTANGELTIRLGKYEPS